MFDDEPDWTTLLLIGGLIFLGSKAVGAVKKISRELERFKNYGLTDAEDEKARATIADPKATTADKMAAITTLRTKIETARAAGYTKQVAPLATALDILERELRAQDELEPMRKAWQERQAAAKASKAPAKW
jgi:hypothetical protein